MTFKNPRLFNKGTYDIKKLIMLGFLYCQHEDIFTKKESLWGLINPEVKPTTSKKSVKEVFE